MAETTSNSCLNSDEVQVMKQVLITRAISNLGGCSGLVTSRQGGEANVLWVVRKDGRARGYYNAKPEIDSNTLTQEGVAWACETELCNLSISDLEALHPMNDELHELMALVDLSLQDWMQ